MMFPEKSKKEIERMKLGFNDLIIVVQEAVQLISGMEEPAGGEQCPYYDMFEDWDLIVSSFLSQYGLRIRTKEFETVSWDEFKALIAGLSPETALGRVVAIRSETDKDIIKHYTKDQRCIYDDWRNREMKEMDEETFEKEMAGWRRCLRLCAEVVKIEKIRCVRCGQTVLLAEYVKGKLNVPDVNHKQVGYKNDRA